MLKYLYQCCFPGKLNVDNVWFVFFYSFIYFVLNWFIFCYRRIMEQPTVVALSEFKQKFHKKKKIIHTHTACWSHWPTSRNKQRNLKKQHTHTITINLYQSNTSIIFKSPATFILILLFTINKNTQTSYTNHHHHHHQHYQLQSITTLQNHHNSVFKSEWKITNWQQYSNKNKL